jgi:hypothetical protein
MLIDERGVQIMTPAHEGDPEKWSRLYRLTDSERREDRGELLSGTPSRHAHDD